MEYVITGTDDPQTFPHHLDKQVGSLTFRWKSPMKRAFADFLRRKCKARVVLLADRAAPDRVLAWGCLVWPAGEPAAAPEVMLYVRRGYRKFGFATQVFWALRHSLGGAGVPYTYYPHDPASSAFYQRQIEKRAAGGVPTPAVTWLAAP